MTAVATPAIDLAAYFRRIGYSGETAPTLDVLRAIHLRHAQTIAFENLNPLLRWPVRLDPESLEQKLVLGGRGGYCFAVEWLWRPRARLGSATLRQSVTGPISSSRILRWNPVQ